MISNLNNKQDHVSISHNVLEKDDNYYHYYGVRDAKMVTRQDLPKAAMIVQIVVETVFTLTE